MTQTHDALWAGHTAEWRGPAQVTSQWREAENVDRRIMRFTTRGNWWETLASLRITLLVTREYEHLVMALHHDGGKPHITFQPLPHPSGLAVDRKKGIVHIASTRNPNQVYDFEPVERSIARRETREEPVQGRPLVPVRSRFYAGCMYLHDLAFIDGSLHANAVAHNAVVRLDPDGGFERVWWPRCIETARGPAFGLNYLQLNSIAAGGSVSQSFFSASADRMSRRRPGHRNFPVDKRGVIFSGATGEPIVRGLTRPHSARLHRKRLWVDNSGYGEFGYADKERFAPVTGLPGWTRGLCFAKNIAFVGTSRIIPGFRQYAPGLNPERSLCGVHAVDITDGSVLGSLFWPRGSQIFSVDWVPGRLSTGFPFRATGKRMSAREKALFYCFETASVRGRNR